jgi:Tol biopolymer transport system component
MNRLCLLLITLLHFSFLSAQPGQISKAKTRVNELMSREAFVDALELLNNLILTSPDDHSLTLLQGICYLNIEHKQKDAVDALEKATENLPLHTKKNTQAIEARYYLGQAYHKNYQFEEAVKILESLRKKIPPKQKDLLVKIDREINYNLNAIALSKHPVGFKITNLGQHINTPFDEHSQIISADESMLIFTSNRDNINNRKNPDGSNFDEIYVSYWRDKDWTIAQKLEELTFNTSNNASISLSNNGKTLYLYSHDGISGDLYESQLTFEGWSTPVKLNKPINTSYNETHASLSPDGQVLYFASDRPGGFGGSDIYMVRKLPTGEWGKEVNLGAAINTSGDEDSPYIHPDNQTLFFSSTEHLSMGGFDIFKTSLSDSMEWQTPVNVGYPINTPEDDLFYLPLADGQRVYMASRRDGGMGNSDLYLIELNDDDPRILAVVAGFIFDSRNRPIEGVTITIADKNNKEIIGYYRPSPTTGKYVMIIPAGKSYVITYTINEKTIVKELDLPGRTNFSSGNIAVYLDPILVP